MCNFLYHVFLWNFQKKLGKTDTSKMFISELWSCVYELIKLWGNSMMSAGEKNSDVCF